MIDADIGRAAFRLGVFIALVSGVLSWLTEPDTAEHVISIFTLIISLIFLAVIAILVRIGSRR